MRMKRWYEGTAVVRLSTRASTSSLGIAIDLLISRLWMQPRELDL